MHPFWRKQNIVLWLGLVIVCGALGNEGLPESGSQDVAALVKKLGGLSLEQGRDSRLLRRLFFAAAPGTWSRPPSTRETRIRLLEVFEKTTLIQSVGPLLNWGPTSYYLAVDFESEGKTIPAAVRLTRQGVAPFIHHNALIWNSAIEVLEAQANPKDKLLGTYLRETFSFLMETLGEGGSEVDLNKERELFQMATPVYERSRRTRSGYAIRVVPVLKDLQQKVLPEWQNAISIYHRSPSLSIRQHPQRKKLAHDASRVWLESAFYAGIWDWDNDERHWRVDEHTNTLWRTSLSGVREASVKELRLHQEITHWMLKPFWTPSDRRRMVALAQEGLFDSSLDPSLLAEALDSVFKLPAPPGSPVSKLYFYRDQLQQAVGSAVYFSRSTLWYLQTLAHNPIFVELTGPWSFYRTLSDAAGLTAPEAAISFAVWGIRSCARRVLGFSSEWGP